MTAPAFVLGAGDDNAWPPDPIASPWYYHGVTWRRVVAYWIDLLIILLILVGLHLIAAVLTVMSLGLLWPLHVLVVPLLVALAYHSLQIAGIGATLGMRIFGLRAHSVLGGAVNLPQAVIHTLCFYGSVMVTSCLVLLLALFNARRRTLHDLLAGVVVLRAP